MNEWSIGYTHDCRTSHIIRPYVYTGHRYNIQRQGYKGKYRAGEGDRILGAGLLVGPKIVHRARNCGFRPCR